MVRTVDGSLEILNGACNRTPESCEIEPNHRTRRTSPRGVVYVAKKCQPSTPGKCLKTNSCPSAFRPNIYISFSRRPGCVSISFVTNTRASHVRVQINTSERRRRARDFFVTLESRSGLSSGRRCLHARSVRLGGVLLL